MLSSKDKEKPSRLSLGQLSRLQESTQRNADELFGAIVDGTSSPKPAAPAPVFRSITEKTEPTPAPAAPAPSPVLAVEPIPAPAPPAAAPTGGEGEGEISATPSTKPARRLAKPGAKGNPCAAHPGESKRENLVSVRFTPEQMEDLEHWAEAERLPLAVMCRDIILKEMHRNRSLIQKIREFRQGLTKTSA